MTDWSWLGVPRRGRSALSSLIVHVRCAGPGMFIAGKPCEPEWRPLCGRRLGALFFLVGGRGGGRVSA